MREDPFGKKERGRQIDIHNHRINNKYCRDHTIPFAMHPESKNNIFSSAVVKHCGL